MSDSEHSTVTYTSVSEDDLDMGSPGIEVPIFEVPPSPDYIPGPEGPPSPDYASAPEEPEPCTTFNHLHTCCSAACLPVILTMDDEVFPAEEQPLPAADSPTHQSPGYIPESDPEEDLEEDDEEDPEEDPADYPADRGDDDDDAEDEHLAPAEPAAVAYSADQDPYIAYRVTARMSIRTQAPTPFLSEEVAERLLALPTPPPSPLSPYSSPLPQIPSPPLPISSPPPNGPTYVEGSLGSRAAGIRQRDALPVHETEMPEMCLPLQAPQTQWSRELGYGIRDTWDDLVGAIQEIAPTTLEGVNQRVIELSSTVDQEDEIIYSQLDDARLSRAAWARSMDACDQVHSEGISLRTTVMAQESEITELQAADRRRQAMITDKLKADYRRQRQLVETLKIVKSLKTQMIELQRQQGPAKDPAEPELPEEASSSS
ncbi:hypothetical protein Tco_1180336 [Tanacetum coccineum]